MNNIVVDYKKELEQSFDFHGCCLFVCFLLLISAESFKFIHFLFICLCCGAFGQEVKVKMAATSRIN